MFCHAYHKADLTSDLRNASVQLAHYRLTVVQYAVRTYPLSRMCSVKLCLILDFPIFSSTAVFYYNNCYYCSHLITGLQYSYH